MRKHPYRRLAEIGDPKPPPAKAPPQWQEAPLYQPDPELTQAIEIAMALGQPALLTGQPGCGKTSSAYWAAWHMGLGPDDLFHVQVRSDASAARLRYEFDAVRYFREAQISKELGRPWEDDRKRFIRRGPLWLAFDAARTRRAVLLVDEIDKAPRDFPNDLLHEFDQLEFEVPDDLDEEGRPVKVSALGGPADGLALIVITSNGERDLPDAFLRRCVHHHLHLSPEAMRRVIDHRMKQGDLTLAKELVDYAVRRFVALQDVHGLRHKPGLAELLVWLHVIALKGEVSVERLRDVRLGELPYLGTLLKDPADGNLVRSTSG